VALELQRLLQLRFSSLSVSVSCASDLHQVNRAQSGLGPVNGRGTRRTAAQRQKETIMEDNLVRKITSNPAYQELKRKRTSFGIWLTISMLVVYYGFILLVAFNKQLLSTRLGEGVMTLGMPIGLGVIVFTVVITAFYVRRANNEFDRLSDEVSKAALK
jgi:uncharacterized membrane protein (DUF485 family)